MAVKIVRSSKYRHVFANEPNKGNWDGVKLTKNAWDSNYATASAKWIAMAWESAGGGSVGILDVNKPGKLEPTKVPLLTGHKSAVLDLDFSQFNDNILATCSEDATVKIWSIPDGGFTGHNSEAAQTLSGHAKKVGAIKWHPCADNLIASSSQDYSVRVWDVEHGKSMYKVEGYSQIIQSVEWKYDGSVLVTNSKDKFVRIVDPRNSKIVAEAESHVGVKGGRALWLGKNNLIVTVGFGKGASREYKLFDPRKFETHIAQQQLDSAAGVIMPFYDEDSDLLFFAGKGDGQIRYFEIIAEEEPSKIVNHVGQFSSNNPTAAACSVPRRCCDVSQTEILRIYKISKSIIYPLKFQVPRKSTDVFAEELYPLARGDQPALTKEEWMEGKDATPKLVSLEGGFVASERAASTTYQQQEASSATSGDADYKSLYEDLKKSCIFRIRIETKR